MGGGIEMHDHDSACLWNEPFEPARPWVFREDARTLTLNPEHGEPVRVDLRSCHLPAAILNTIMEVARNNAVCNEEVGALIHELDRFLDVPAWLGPNGEERGSGVGRRGQSADAASGK